MYFLSANKACRPVYTSTQRRENLQSCYCRDDLIVNPLCLHLCLIRLHYNYCSFEGLNIQIIPTSTTPYGLCRCIFIGSSTSNYFYVPSRQVLPTSGSQSTYWGPSVYLLVALSLPTGGSQSTYWWLSVYLLVAVSLPTGGSQSTQELSAFPWTIREQFCFSFNQNNFKTCLH
jgi:hypothetical protein